MLGLHGLLGHDRATFPVRGRDGDDIAGCELSPASQVDLAVHADFALGDELPGLGSGLGEVRKLEKLTESDALAVDDDWFGSVHAPIVPALRNYLSVRSARSRLAV